MAASEERGSQNGNRKKPERVSAGNKRVNGNKPAQPNVASGEHRDGESRQFRPAPGVAQFKLQPTSLVVDRFLTRQSAKTNNAFMRIGTLLRMLANDPVNQKKITDWLDILYEGVVSNIAADSESLKTLGDGQDLSLEVIKAENTEPRVFYVNHPNLVRFVRKINDIDELAYLVDQLWYLGAVTDEQKEMANKKLMYPITATTEHFMMVTNVVRRSGGQYTPEQFLALLAEEQDMRAFIIKHFPTGENFAELVKRVVGIE